MPPKKILVPFDFSRTGLKAWELGRELARALKASIEVVFVYELPIYTDSLTPLPVTPILINPLTKELERKLIGDIQRELGEDVPVTILQGLPADEILGATQGRAIDLIVMGTHGRTGIPRALFGSVAENISRRSSVPVLTTRERCQPVKSILAPINFAAYSLDGFFAAAELARRLEARLDALYVAERPYSETLLEIAFNEALRKLPPYFEAKAPRLLRGTGNPAQRIVTVGMDYDLIVLVAHRKSMFHDVILGTTAERVLRHSPTPVLALPDSSKSISSLLERKTTAQARL